MSTSQFSAPSRASLESVEGPIHGQASPPLIRPVDDLWKRVYDAIKRMVLEESWPEARLPSRRSSVECSELSTPSVGLAWPPDVRAGQPGRTRRRAALRGQCRADVLLGRLEVKLARRYRATGATNRNELTKVLARELWSKSSEELASLVWTHLGRRITGRSIRRTHKTRGPLSKKWEEWARYRAKGSGSDGTGQETTAADLVCAGLLGRTMREVQHGGGRTKTLGPPSELMEERDADRAADRFLQEHGVDLSEMPAE